MTLKKCVWLRCCYGKKPYGNPPLIPWCSSCEFQRKLVSRQPVTARARSSSALRQAVCARCWQQRSLIEC
eukprot:COSAG01_NODE_3239_length_6369_cov_4.207018_3_plen_70_part_00